MSSERAHKRVLIAGATGRLGVIIDVLLERGHSVRAMTRNLTSPAAERLRYGWAIGGWFQVLT